MPIALLSLLPSLLGNLPSVIGFVETLFGGQSGQSSNKLAAAVELLQLIVPELEAALGANPAIKALLDGLVSIAVKYMNLNGTMPVVAAPAVGAAPNPSLAQPSGA